MWWCLDSVSGRGRVYALGGGVVGQWQESPKAGGCSGGVKTLRPPGLTVRDTAPGNHCPRGISGKRLVTEMVPSCWCPR